MKLKDDIIERLGITKYAKYLNLYISISDCDLKLERERKIIKILKKKSFPYSSILQKELKMNLVCFLDVILIKGYLCLCGQGIQLLYKI